jgi:hypothetical protein
MGVHVAAFAAARELGICNELCAWAQNATIGGYDAALTVGVAI